MFEDDNSKKNSAHSQEGFFKSPFAHQDDLDRLGEAEKILEEEIDINPYTAELKNITISKPPTTVGRDEDVQVFPDETIEALSNSPKGRRSHDKLKMEEIEVASKMHTKEEIDSKESKNKKADEKALKKEKKLAKKDSKWNVNKNTLAMSAYDTHSSNANDKKKKKEAIKEEKRKADELKQTLKLEEKNKNNKNIKDKKDKNDGKKEEKILQEILPIAPLLNKSHANENQANNMPNVEMVEEEVLTAQIANTNGESIEDIAYNNMYVPAEIVYDQYGNPDVVQTLNVAMFDRGGEAKMLGEIDTNAKIIDRNMANNEKVAVQDKKSDKSNDKNEDKSAKTKDTFNMHTSFWLEEAGNQEETRIAHEYEQISQRLLDLNNENSENKSYDFAAENTQSKITAEVVEDNRGQSDNLNSIASTNENLDVNNYQFDNNDKSSQISETAQTAIDVQTDAQELKTPVCNEEATCEAVQNEMVSPERIETENNAIVNNATENNASENNAIENVAIDNNVIAKSETENIEANNQFAKPNETKFESEILTEDVTMASFHKDVAKYGETVDKVISQSKPVQNDKNLDNNDVTILDNKATTVDESVKENNVESLDNKQLNAEISETDKNSSSFVTQKDYEQVEKGGDADPVEKYSTNSDYNPHLSDAKERIEKLLAQEDDGVNWKNSDDKFDENGIIAPPKMAKLAKLPQIIDYFISLNLKRDSYVKIANFLVMAYKKFEKSPENLQYVEICIKKIIPCLMIK